GIRYFHVTGVQTCALPILQSAVPHPAIQQREYRRADAPAPYLPFIVVEVKVTQAKLKSDASRATHLPRSIEKCCVASCSSEPFSELSSREGVARVDVAGLVADLEPANALRGRTVCKRFRHDVAARTLLQAVV